MSIDFYSQTWREIARFCHQQREFALNKLIEGSHLDDFYRGQIAAFDSILLHESPETPATVEKPTNYLM